jgi:hypothetical protein
MGPQIARLLARIRAALRLRTRYTRALENEIARLRAENRALVNSILGVAGIPPMRAAARTAASRHGFVGARLASPGRPQGRPYENAPANPDAPEHVAVQAGGQFARHSLALSAGEGSVVTRHCSPRRRSWQQIGRALEIEDARAVRRERESNTDTFPTPRRTVPRL